ncbi:putative chitinase [Azorhizobium sp. AG788]|uniref:peptidoglycan-binding protein n=1 Tax=Azorhizobium sp. AG788 TaxID=2183897 RepID=UPI00105B43E4|nr:peptidoglycan-binding protein [Azorhizobium sp. AG788]TDT94933.1 putative chitinase [Azorhizobium sp. AG788]
MRAIDIVRRVAPKARPEYLAAFEGGDAQLEAAGVTTPLRLAHLLAQVLHETGRLTITRESGAYHAPQILAVFGQGIHSAAVRPTEAAKLAGDGPSLFERVYGLGNPSMAKALGNTQPGDGWTFRGNGLLQTTGRGQHREMGQRSGVGDLFERDPSQVTAPEHALKPALAEWTRGKCNTLADKGDIRQITRIINGGYNGYSDRVAWLNKVWAVLGTGEVWQAGAADDAIADLQESLNTLGYGLKVDGRQGPATTAAIRDFQSRNNLTADGIAGPVTLAALAARLAPAKSPKAA